MLRRRRGSARYNTLPWNLSVPARNAAFRPATNLPRNTRLSTLMGRKKRREELIHRVMIRGQAAGRQNTMDMRVKLQSLVPGVQHAEEADLRSQMARIAGYLEQRLRAGMKQQVENDLLVLQSQRRQFARQSEDGMHVACGQQFPLPAPRASAGGRCPDTSGNAGCHTSYTRWRRGRSLSIGRDDRRAKPCGSAGSPAEPCGASR